MRASFKFIVLVFLLGQAVPGEAQNACLSRIDQNLKKISKGLSFTQVYDPKTKISINKDEVTKDYSDYFAELKKIRDDYKKRESEISPGLVEPGKLRIYSGFAQMEADIEKLNEKYKVDQDTLSLLARGDIVAKTTTFTYTNPKSSAKGQTIKVYWDENGRMIAYSTKGYEAHDGVDSLGFTSELVMVSTLR